MELKIILDLQKHDVGRKIIVQIDITFKKLHEILQIVFDWKDRHMHDYYIFDGDKPVANLVCSEEAFDFPVNLPMINETDIKLSGYVPKFSRIKYTYDFGDNWEHYIEIEKVIDDYAQNYPVCIAGIGNAPPEDVGGEGGCEEFLEAISDPNHPEYKSMMDWSKSQWYRDFDYELTNRRLKYSFVGDKI